MYLTIVVTTNADFYITKDVKHNAEKRNYIQTQYERTRILRIENGIGVGGKWDQRNLQS